MNGLFETWRLFNINEKIIKKNNIDRILSKITPAKIIAAFAICLLACYTAILLFDVFNVFGVRSFLETSGLGAPAVWYHLFSARSPTEYLQTFLLGLFALSCVYISGRGSELLQNRLGYFWFMIGLFALILLVEEGADLSRRYQTIMEIIMPGAPFLSSRAFIFSIYMLIGLVPLVLYFKDIYAHKKPFFYLVAGYLVYGFAGIQSVFLNFIGLSRVDFGMFIFYDLLGGVLHFPLNEVYSSKEYIAFLFVDYVIEEPLELLAICFLLCSVFSYIAEIYKPEGKIKQG